MFLIYILSVQNFGSALHGQFVDCFKIQANSIRHVSEKSFNFHHGVLLAQVSPVFEIEGSKLNNVESFTYFGSTLNSTCSMDKEVSNRLAEAGASFGRLWTRVWGERGLKLRTKLVVYKAVVITPLSLWLRRGHSTGNRHC